MKAFALFVCVLAGLGALILFQYPSLASGEPLLKQGPDLMEAAPQEPLPQITLAGGCFWCVESEFRGREGVVFTRVGYMGGGMENPTYQDITTGKTGHAEAVEITYDPDKTTYRELVEFFLRKAHDPTQVNRQGVDVGPQYRSAIFYADEEEKQIAQSIIDEINTEGLYDAPIATTLEPLSTFWMGEEYHQQYYEKYREKTGRDHIRVILKH